MRRLVRWLVAVAVLTVGLGLSLYPVYVRPQIDPLRRADAILVVGGDAPAPRYRYGVQLAQQGWAPHLLVSNPPGGQVPAACARTDPRFTVECFRPNPGTTLGEARALRRLADERGWRTVIVVTYPPHISRARYILHKCFAGELIMVATPARLGPLDWAWMYVYQSAGYLKSFVQGSC